MRMTLEERVAKLEKEWAEFEGVALSFVQAVKDCREMEARLDRTCDDVCKVLDELEKLRPTLEDMAEGDKWKLGLDEDE